MWVHFQPKHKWNKQQNVQIISAFNRQHFEKGAQIDEASKSLNLQPHAKKNFN